MARHEHYVAAHLLRRFARKDGRLWMYDREAPGEPRLVNPRHLAVELGMYDMADGDSLEDLLTEHIDTPGHRILEKLCVGEPLTVDDKQRFALYLVTQEVRTPATRDHVLSMMSEVMERIAEVQLSNTQRVKEVLKRLGSPVTDDMVELMRRGVAEKRIRVQMRPDLWLRVLLSAGRVAQLVSEMDWFIAEAPEEFEFVITDNPVTKVLTDRSLPMMAAGGWLSPSSEGTLPLDPDHVLVVRPIGPTGHGPIDKRWCKDVNSRRFVFAQNREDWIYTVMRKHPVERDDSARAEAV